MFNPRIGSSFIAEHAERLENWLVEAVDAAQSATNTMTGYPLARQGISTMTFSNNQKSETSLDQLPPNNLIAPALQITGRTIAVVFPGLLLAIILMLVSNGAATNQRISDLSTTLQLLTAKVTSLEALLSADLGEIKKDLGEIEKSSEALNMRVTALEALKNR